MADGYVSNPGSGGTTFASDDIGGTHWPRVKVTSGADGTAADVSITAPMPVAALAESNQLTVAAVPVTVKFAAIDAATSGNNTLLAAVSARKIRVVSLFLVSAGTVTVRFESGADGGALTGQMNLVANTGFVLPYNPAGWFETASNTLLNLELSGAVSVDGSFSYIEV
jgi:hypothetical protein